MRTEVQGTTNFRHVEAIRSVPVLAAFPSVSHWCYAVMPVTVTLSIHHPRSSQRARSSSEQLPAIWRFYSIN
jgi:hypothetical protein